ncbi:MAG: undecaprenyl-diphosphate phosphatase [Candidatus Bipolaricaulota bacterium]
MALGLIQGLTEFLPVSSSGHLVIFKHLFGLQGPNNPLLEALLHFGTLIAVFVAFRGRIKKIILSPLPGSDSEKGGKYLIHLLVATVPIAVIGLLAKDFIEAAFNSVRSAGAGLLVTGIVLFALRYRNTVGSERDMDSFNWKDSLSIGLAQVTALFPGISRSGVTISTGLFKKLEPGLVAEFSFLLMVPAVLGANALQVWEVFSENSISSIPLGGYLLGTVISAVSGFFAIKWLLQLLRRGELSNFSYYCLALGGAVLIWSFM